MHAMQWVQFLPQTGVPFLIATLFIGQRFAHCPQPPQSKYTDAVKNSYADYSDAALVVITRIGGEGFDLPRYQGDSEGAVSPDSHYLELDQNEIDLLTAVTDGTFKRVVVVFNTPSSFEATFLKDSAYAAFADKIDAAVWIGFTGSNGITALGEILNGDVNPRPSGGHMGGGLHQESVLRKLRHGLPAGHDRQV